MKPRMANADKDSSLLTSEEAAVWTRDIQGINNLLAKERWKARDHGGAEKLMLGEKMFQGASLLIGTGVNKDTGKKETFHILTVNMHVHDGNPKARRCAESLGVGEVLRHFEENSIQVNECNFMGGQSKVVSTNPAKLAIDPNDIGKHVSPCGTCCDLLDRYGTPQTLYRIFPLNDGKLEVIHDDISSDVDHGPHKLNRNQIWEIAQRHVIGVKSYQPENQTQAQADAGAALAYLKTPAIGTGGDPDQFKMLQKDGGWNMLADMEDAVETKGIVGYSNDVLRQIHGFMMQYARRKMQEPETDISRATIAILRTVDRTRKSHFRLGLHTEGVQEGRDIQSSFNGAESALHEMSNSLNGETPTDLFFMDLEPKQLQAMADGVIPAESHAPSLSEAGFLAKGASRFTANLRGMPESGKYFYRPEEAETKNIGNQMRVHVLMPADPDQKFNAAQLVKTYGLSDIIKHGFVGKDMGQANTEMAA